MNHEFSSCLFYYSSFLFFSFFLSFFLSFSFFFFSSLSFFLFFLFFLSVTIHSGGAGRCYSEHQRAMRRAVRVAPSGRKDVWVAVCASAAAARAGSHQAARPVGLCRLRLWRGIHRGTRTTRRKKKKKKKEDGEQRRWRRKKMQKTPVLRRGGTAETKKKKGKKKKRKKNQNKE